MLNYLEKFNSLPGELRRKISDPAVMKNISEIEKKYDLTLAMVVMRVMVKDISIVDLAKYFVFEHDMDGRKAEKLVEDLKKEVFARVADYLGFGAEEERVEKIAEGEEAAGDWLSEKKKEMQARGSSFFFSSEDEEEIQELTKKVENFTSGEKIETVEEVDARIDKDVNEVRRKLGINFSSEELSNRFGQILKTYLKGIRNKIDTKQTFIKKVENGGLGMEPIFTDNILLLADSIETENKNKPVEKSKVINTELSSKDKNNDFSFSLGGARDIDYDFSKMPKIEKKKDSEIEVITETAGSIAPKKSEEVEKTPDVLEFNLEPKREVEKIISSNKIKITPKLDAHPESKMADIVSLKKDQAKDGRKKIADVKHVPKLVGPIDELGEISLLNFRRLSADPREAVLKIKEKLKFLEEDSYAQRLAGIKAWRMSPVNKIYLQIGTKSIGEKKTVSQVIEEMMNSGKDYLTENEFKAVMDLNRSIRF